MKYLLALLIIGCAHAQPLLRSEKTHGEYTQCWCCLLSPVSAYCERGAVVDGLCRANPDEFAPTSASQETVCDPTDPWTAKSVIETPHY